MRRVVGIGNAEAFLLDDLRSQPLAATTLGHRDPRVTSDFYVHADGIVVSTGWQGVIVESVGSSRESLAI